MGFQTFHKLGVLDTTVKGINIETYSDRVELAMAQIYKAAVWAARPDGGFDRDEARAFWDDVRKQIEGIEKVYWEDHSE